MSSIKISELRPAGSELFQDSESFLNELKDQETLMIAGGDGSDVDISVISQNSKSIGVSLLTVSVVTEVKSPVTFKK